MANHTSFFKEHPKKLPNCREPEPDLNDDESVLSADQRAYVWSVKYLYSLHADWRVYKELFATSNQRVEELNKFSGAVFHYIQFSQSDRVALGVAKLIDDDGHALSRLAEFKPREGMSKPEKVALASRKAEVRNRCKRLSASHAVLMKHRDKRIAHADYAVLTKSTTLDELNFEAIDSALEDVGQVFSEIHDLRYGGEVAFHGAHWDLASACEQFLKVIESGNQVMEQQIAEIAEARA